MDINKVWLSGLAVTEPKISRLNSKTLMSTFQLQVNETFIDRNGVAQIKPSTLTIESLGKMAEATADKVSSGNRYTVDGYLRQESSAGILTVKVRTFAVYPDKSVDGMSHKEGIRVALQILGNSKDKEDAIKALEELIK